MKKQKSNLIVQAISTQREIAEIQLERLKIISRERLLSYEETKIYDLLTKNLLLVKKDEPSIDTTSSSVIEQEALTDNTLIELAQAIDENLINKSLDFIDKEESNG